MEGYVGGTEIQLGIQPLAVVENPRLTYKDVVEELISANNETRLYGIKSGKHTSWLYNGGLLYYDMQHPEYATPECKSLDDLVAYEFAGRRIVENLLGLVTKPLRSRGMAQYSVFAGNSDYRLGPSTVRRLPNVWAYHENYAAVNPESEVAGILPFLTTRHLFAGAGFILSERLAKEFGVDFLIAQRASAVWRNEEKLYVGQYSALVGPNRHNREVLHVTVGDANVSDYATRLKIGTTVLVHQLLEAGRRPPGRFLGASQSEYVANTWVTCAGWWERCSFGGQVISAIDVQRIYLEAAKKMFSGRDEDTNWVLVQWEKTLDGLEKDPMSCTQLDWVLKKWYLETRRGKLSREELVRFDLCYHAADPDKSTFRLLAEHFGIANQVSQQQIIKAIDYPPGNTRAAARAIGVRAIAHAVEALGGESVPEIGWSYISYLRQRLDIPEPDKTYIDRASTFARNVESHLPTSKERR